LTQSKHFLRLLGGASLKPNSITLAGSKPAPNRFGAGSKLASNMFGASLELVRSWNLAYHSAC